MSALVKICGICRPEDGIAAVQAGADLIGLIFARESKRLVGEQEAARIVEAVRACSDQVRTVGVFVNEDPRVIARTASVVGLDLIQYHGEESDDEIATVGLPAIRVLRVRDRLPERNGASDEPPLEGACHPERSEGSRRKEPLGTRSFPVLRCAPAAQDDEAASFHSGEAKRGQFPAGDDDWVLFDTWIDGARGGTGRTFDWTILDGVSVPRPFFLSGGLDPENVRRAIEEVRPDGVDVSSGVEDEPRIKNHEKIERFIRQVRR